MKKKIRNFYFLPFTIIFALPLLFFAFNNEGGGNYIAFICTITIPLVFRIVFNIKPFIFILVSFPILLLAIVFDIMVLDFNSYVNVNSWNSIFNTNLYEATELSSDIRFITKIMISIHVFVYVFYLFLMKGKHMKNESLKVRYIAVVLLLIFGLDYYFVGATQTAFPMRSTRSFFEYFQIKSKEVSYLATKLNVSFYSKREEDNKKKETIVVVVGESLRRDHLGYYGYKKETTPLLGKENIICYSDVISPANYSIGSLKRIFSLAEFKNEVPYLKLPTLIKCFKEVGFKTYWISTQRIYGRFDSEISFIAKESDSITFKSPLGYDEALFKPYQQLLNNRDTKKIIFIHVMGNHVKYTKRYPEEYTYFQKDKNERQNFINAYDNAVRYNDYIIYHFLNMLKRQEGESVFLMFSDHGESLFDSGRNVLNHGSIKPAKSEYDIPLILWFSNTFKKNHTKIFRDAVANKDKSIILSDFFHALPSLFQIKFSKLNSDNNFFGNFYKEKKDRKVINGAGELIYYNTLKKQMQ